MKKLMMKNSEVKEVPVKSSWSKGEYIERLQNQTSIPDFYKEKAEIIQRLKGGDSHS